MAFSMCYSLSTIYDLTNTALTNMYIVWVSMVTEYKF